MFNTILFLFLYILGGTIFGRLYYLFNIEEAKKEDEGKSKSHLDWNSSVFELEMLSALSGVFLPLSLLVFLYICLLKYLL